MAYQVEFQVADGGHVHSISIPDGSHHAHVIGHEVARAIQRAYDRGRKDQHEIDSSFVLAALEGQRPITR